MPDGDKLATITEWSSARWTMAPSWILVSFADLDVVMSPRQDGGGPDAAAGGKADVADDDSLGGERKRSGQSAVSTKRKRRALVGPWGYSLGRFRFFSVHARICYRGEVSTFTFWKKIVVGIRARGVPTLALANIATRCRICARGTARQGHGRPDCSSRCAWTTDTLCRRATRPMHLTTFTITVYFDGVPSAMEVFYAQPPAIRFKAKPEPGPILMPSCRDQRWLTCIRSRLPPVGRPGCVRQEAHSAL